MIFFYFFLLFRADELQVKNGGELAVVFYVGVGPDGSNGHEMHKRMTESSLLDGSCIITTFVSIQFVTEVNGKTFVLHTNPLLGASDTIRCGKFGLVFKGLHILIQKEA